MIHLTSVRSFAVLFTLGLLSPAAAVSRDGALGAPERASSEAFAEHPARASRPRSGSDLANIADASGRRSGAPQSRDLVTVAKGSPVPAFPGLLASAGVSGVVVIEVEVDVTGVADTSSVKILVNSHQLFANSVEKSVGQMRFNPATRGGRKIKDKVRVAFRFNADGRTLADTTRYPVEVVVDSRAKH